MRIGTVLALAALVVILGFSLVYAYQGLTTPGDPMPASAWIAMAIGVVISLVVGIGLMALLFYSSRRGYDEPPHFSE